MPRFALLVLLFVLVPTSPAAVRNPVSPGLQLPEGSQAVLEDIYSWHIDRAIPEARQIQRQFPEHPLGYLLEGEAEWWRIWCTSAEFKYGINMPRHREKVPSDAAYLELAGKATALAESSLKKQETAEMHLYAGMAEAQSARLYGLRGEARATAREGVRARAHFERALAMDSSLADACMGLGLYDYYVDTLSTMARVLRFVMGIPGGSKADGIQLMQRAIREGQLTPAVSRFNLAINLHNYDQRYEEALAIIAPLADRYPTNPIFQLARGDLYAKLGRKQLAAGAYQAANAAALANAQDEDCRRKIEQLVQQSLAALTPRSEK